MLNRSLKLVKNQIIMQQKIKVKEITLIIRITLIKMERLKT